MTPYEKILRAARMQQIPETKIQLGTVRDGGRIELAEIKLEASDYLTNALLDIFTYTDSDGDSLTIDNRLRPGDTVALYRVSDAKWIVIGRFA